MKIRSNFVSNSSSSSFILGTLDKSKKDGKIKVTIETDISPLIENRLTTEEELKEYFKDRYWNGVESPLYQKCLEVIKKEGAILIGSAANDDYDNPISNYLYENGFKDIESDFTIIESERG